MPSCCAVGCTNRSEKGFKLSRFPRDGTRRKIWAQKVRRTHWEPSESSYLCSVHFEGSCFALNSSKKRRLKKDAVPTIFPHLPAPRRNKRGRPPPVRLRRAALLEHQKNGVRNDHIYAPPCGRIKEEEDGREAITPSIVKQENRVKAAPEAAAASVAYPHEKVHQLEKEIVDLKTKLRIAEVKAQSYKKMTRFLNDDQKTFLLRDRNGFVGYSWSDETVKAAQRFRSSCGITGYKALLKAGFPLPALSTLATYKDG